MGIPEFEGAQEIFHLHNKVEEVAYSGLVNKVISLGIVRNGISENESQLLLQHIKQVAHRELFRKDGYWASRTKLLKPEQIDYVLKQYGHIVHDRDTKLTRGTYHYLSDLLMAFDDHNTMVKTILFTSWFQEPKPLEDENHSHLEMIKEKVRFYERLDEALPFSLKDVLEEKKTFWDTYFPGKRLVGEGTSEDFLNICHVRYHFHVLTEGKNREIQTLDGTIHKIFRSSLARTATKLLGPHPFFDEAVTLREFIEKYFPDSGYAPEHKAIQF